MKKNFFLLAAVLLCVCGTAFGWGKTGHDAIAYIAECNLTPRAKKNIGKYLDGRSIVYYASWMDAVRATEPYRATSKWHGFDADAECRYVPRPAEGDAVLGIEDAMEKLRGYRRQDDSTVRVAICCLVHLVGDKSALGQYRDVKITDSNTWALFGEMLPASKEQRSFDA